MEDYQHPLFQAIAAKVGLELHQVKGMSITTEGENVRVEWSGISTISKGEFNQILRATENEGWQL